MRLKKKDAYIKAQENLINRAKLQDKARGKYEKAIERLKKAQEALSPEELTEVQQVAV